MAELIFGEHPECDYPQVVLQVRFPDGTGMRIVGDVDSPETFLVMIQCLGQQKLLEPETHLALVRTNHGTDNK